MRLTLHPLTSRLLGLSALAGLLSSCSLPPAEAWQQINQRGLIPVLINPYPSMQGPGAQGGTQLAKNTRKLAPQQENAVRVKAVAPATVVAYPTAKAVPGRVGYAYSPHTSPKRVIDVREFKAGEEARCPYTLQAFLVPTPMSMAQIASNAIPNARSPRQSSRARTEVVSRDRNFTPRERTSAPRVRPRREVVARNEPTTSPRSSAPSRSAPVRRESPASTPPPIVQTTPPEPTVTPRREEPVIARTTPPAPKVEAPRPDAPYGRRVDGRPGFVNSPYATKRQLVDVAGIAPGVEVKCPYSNKLFRVPEPGPTPKPAETSSKPKASPPPSKVSSTNVPPPSREKLSSSGPAPIINPESFGAPPPSP